MSGFRTVHPSDLEELRRDVHTYTVALINHHRLAWEAEERARRLRVIRVLFQDVLQDIVPSSGEAFYDAVCRTILECYGETGAVKAHIYYSKDAGQLATNAKASMGLSSDDDEAAPVPKALEQGEADRYVCECATHRTLVCLPFAEPTPECDAHHWVRHGMTARTCVPLLLPTPSGDADELVGVLDISWDVERRTSMPIPEAVWNDNLVRLGRRLGEGLKCHLVAADKVQAEKDTKKAMGAMGMLTQANHWGKGIVDAIEEYHESCTADGSLDSMSEERCEEWHELVDMLREKRLLLTDRSRVVYEALNEPRVPVNLAAMLDGLLPTDSSLDESVVASTEVHYKRDYPAGLTAKCQAELVREAFSNIVSNAEAAMQKDGGTLFVKGGPQNGMATVHFADTGGGIEPKIIARSQEGPVVEKGKEDPGVGVWICRTLIESQGGRVYFCNCKTDEERSAVLNATSARTWDKRHSETLYGPSGGFDGLVVTVTLPL